MKDIINILMIIALIVFLFYSLPTPADDCSIELEVFTFDGHDTEFDYMGMSPLASYALRCTHYIDRNVSVYAGIKHESSAAYKEIGKGFNGPVFGATYKFISW